MPSRPCKHNNRCMQGLSLAHSDEALERCGEQKSLSRPVDCTESYSRSATPGATPGLCTESYSRSATPGATPILFCPWASVAGRGRKTVTPTTEVRTVALAKRWARCLLHNSVSTVVERLRVQARVRKLDKCPLRAQTPISFSVPSIDSVATPCHGHAAVVDCRPRRGLQHLGTVLSASRPACRTSKVGAG